MVADDFAPQSDFQPQSVKASRGDEFGDEVVESCAVEGADERAEGGDDDEEHRTEGHGD